MPTNNATQDHSVFIEVFGRTDVGKQRDHNEDTFLVADLTTGDRTLQPQQRRRILSPAGMVLAVCDGMGGASSGEVAAQMASDTLYSELVTPPLATETNALLTTIDHALQSANRRIMSAARKDPTRRGMGTTCSVALVQPHHLVTAQVGDSRVYLIREGAILQVTKDQSLLNQLLDTGQISPQDVPNFQHTNVILQALGVVETVVAEYRRVELRQRDRILVCSDGLTGPVGDDAILNVVRSNEDLVAACKQLTDLANQGGGPDNITVVLAEVRGPGLPAPDPTVPMEALSLRGPQDKGSRPQ